MTVGDRIWVYILLFMMVHFGIIAVYTVKIERCIIFGILAVSACVLMMGMSNDFAAAFRWNLLVAVIAGINIAVFRYKVFKTYGVCRFRIGRWGRLAPFALEAVALAVMAALYVNSRLAAERFFDRLENGIDKFAASSGGAEQLVIPAPRGSSLVFLTPYVVPADNLELLELFNVSLVKPQSHGVVQADFPAVVNRRLGEIASVNDVSRFALVDSMGWIFVRNDRWSFSSFGGTRRVLRWHEVNSVIRVGVAKDRGSMYLWERITDPVSQSVGDPTFRRQRRGVFSTF